MTSRSFLAFCVSASVAVCPRVALANDEPKLPRWQAGGRTAFAGGNGGLGGLLQADAGYRLVPFLVVGGYAQTVGMEPMTSDGCVNGACGIDYLSFGPRAELETPLSWPVGFWLGVGTGLAVPTDHFGSTKPGAWVAGIDVGFEIRLGPIAIGPYVAWSYFLTTPYEHDPYAVDRSRNPSVGALGLRVAGNF